MNEKYDDSMMKKIDSYNFDGVKVGWYQISYFNDHLNYSSFLTQHDYQTNYRHAIFLVYDLFECKKGGDQLLKAYRISEKFYNLNSSDNKTISFERFSCINFSSKGLDSKYDKFFVEIPVKITSSPLGDAFMKEYRPNFNDQYLKSNNFQFNSLIQGLKYSFHNSVIP